MPVLKHKIDVLTKNGSLLLNSLKYISEQTEVICMENILKNPHELKYVIKQTDDMCAIALNIDGTALAHVKNQTNELCKIAIKQTPKALKYVRCQTDEFCWLVINESPYAFEFVKNKTPEMCAYALSKCGQLLKCIDNPTEEMCIIAINQSIISIYDISNQTEKIHDEFINVLSRLTPNHMHVMSAINGLRYPSIHTIDKLCGWYSKYSRTSDMWKLFIGLSDYVVELVENCELYNHIMTFITEHHTELMYRPYNIYGLIICYTHYQTSAISGNGYSSKLFFLTS